MDSILVTLVVRSVETNEFAVLIRERFKSAQNVVIVLHAYFAPSDEVFPFVFRRIVIGHTENFKSFVMVFVVEFLNVGKRGNAWSAPGGPEIEKNGLALVIGQTVLLPVLVHQGEIRRGNHYDGIIMDPPSYGRGPKGEIWKIEESIHPLVRLCAQLLSDDPLFYLINSYTTGLAPSVLGYLLHLLVGAKYGGKCTWDELGLPVTETGLALPCGATGRWCSE